MKVLLCLTLCCLGLCRAVLAASADSVTTGELTGLALVTTDGVSSVADETGTDVMSIEEGDTHPRFEADEGDTTTADTTTVSAVVTEEDDGQSSGEEDTAVPALTDGDDGATNGTPHYESESP